LKRRN